MAVDALIEMGGRLAELSEETIEKLNGVLPVAWSKGNPVDIRSDASGRRYAEAVGILAQTPEVDALLIMHAPVALVSPTEVAGAVIDACGKTRAAILTSWVGAARWNPRGPCSTGRGSPPTTPRTKPFAPSCKWFVTEGTRSC